MLYIPLNNYAYKRFRRYTRYGPLASLALVMALGFGVDFMVRGEEDIQRLNAIAYLRGKHYTGIRLHDGDKLSSSINQENLLSSGRHGSEKFIHYFSGIKNNKNYHGKLLQDKDGFKEEIKNIASLD